jgi:hypothetical protein
MKKNLDTVDEIQQTLLYLCAIFDIISAATESQKLRDTTLSDFSEFVIAKLDDLYQKVGSIEY